MQDSLKACLNYDIEADSFTLGGQIKPEGVVEIVEMFLRGQMGKGADHSEGNRLSVYHFTISWTPHEDGISVRNDCGNKGLRDGILMHFLKHQAEGKVKEILP